MKPTDAHIEAAVQRERDDIISVIRSTTWSGTEEIVSMIRHRKDATAAEVEGQAMPQLIAQAERNRDNLTIERCAMVAHERLAAGDNFTKVVAAIRALKDKPTTDPNIINPGKDLTNVFPEEEP